MRFFRLLALVFSLYGSCALAASPLPTGAGQFKFRATPEFADKPLTVWYYRPARVDAQTKVLFVMHGAKRNGEDYRDDWQKHAERYNFLLVVPEFSARHFRAEQYSLGNAVQPDHKRWSFLLIERLFDEIRTREPQTAPRYYLYGHSGGAQFVHRFMLLMPQPRVAMAIAANSGTYTMPAYAKEEEAGYPWRLEPKLADPTQLKAAFSRKMLILLGEDDTNPQHRLLNRSAQAEEQGPHRFARGQLFFRTAQQQATALATPFNWQLQTVPGVGHSNSGMAKVAAPLIAAQ